MTVSGFCESRFERVHEEFLRNFAERGEVGASACVTLEGEKVVDLWGGEARVDTGAPWQEDTVSLVMSATKGATALCAHILASRGLLDLDAPVVKYWPEFGKAGKEKITVAMCLGHQAGLPAVRKRLPEGAFYDWKLMVDALADEEPFWEPGTRHGYHALTFGWLVGEIVRRVSGRSLGTFFRDEVAEPLGLDFWIGLPEAAEPRVAPVIPADPPSENQPLPAFVAAAFNPSSIQAAAFGNTGGYMPSEADSRAGHAAEIPAANGITNARGLAGMYAPLACGGSLRGITLVDTDALSRMASVFSASSEDVLYLMPIRYSLGFHKAVDNRKQPPEKRRSLILSEDAFGHVGAGGYLGFADPRAKVSFGYTMNKMGPSGLLNERGQALVDALYLSLGYTSNTSGCWI